MAGKDKAVDSDCWKKISLDLQDVLRSRGPLPLEDVATAYRRAIGINLCLHGYKLRGCIRKGLLSGVVVDGRVLALEKSTGPKTSTTKKSPAPQDAAPMSGTHVGASQNKIKPQSPASQEAAPISGTHIEASQNKKKPQPPASQDAAPISGTHVEASQNKKKPQPPASQDAAPISGTHVGASQNKEKPQSPASHDAAPISGTHVEASQNKKKPQSLASQDAAPISGTHVKATQKNTKKLPPASSASSASSAPLTSSASLASSGSTSPFLSYVVYDKPTWLSTIRAISTANATSKANCKSLSAISAGKPVALRMEGTALGTEAGAISLIEVAARWPKINGAIIFDVVILERTNSGRQILRNELCPLLQDTSSIKVVHNFTDHGIALKRHFGKDFQISRTLDAEIAFEALYGKMSGSIVSILNAFATIESTALPAFSWGDITIGSARPISVDKVMHAASMVVSLLKAFDGMTKALTERGELENVMEASRLRTSFCVDQMLHNVRRMTFRNSSKTPTLGREGRFLVSYELKKAQQDAQQRSAVAKNDTDSSSSTSTETLSPDWPWFAKRMDSPKAVEDPNSPKELLQLIPQAFLQEHLLDRHTANLQDLCEVVLDEGTRPYAQLRGRGRVFLVEDESVLVTKEHIDKVVGNLERNGQFGTDNRAGFPGKLHRISVMRDKTGVIYGATLRVGRFFNGSAGIIDDFLFHAPDSPDSPEHPPSILILGEAGSGKTTAIRDVCRKISAFETLVIVDTSNEIAGAGRSPHREAIGLSRRIMVADKSTQHRVMIEALQNHTPRTIVVDEISNNLEARACQDIKARGVRLVASAHGDLESMLKNPSLNTLLGGTTSVTLGDTMARETRGGNKVQTQRAGIPVFDTIIQLQRSEVNTWSVVRNVAPAVDALLNGGTYEVERRTRIVDDEHKGSEPCDAVFLLEHRPQARNRQRFY